MGFAMILTITRADFIANFSLQCKNFLLRITNLTYLPYLTLPYLTLPYLTLTLP